LPTRSSRRAASSPGADAIGLAEQKIADAKSRLPAAVALWRETLERVAAVDVRSVAVPASSNGARDAASGDDAD
jgi:hypothetical protein